MRVTLFFAGLVLVILGILAIGKAVASKTRNPDRTTKPPQKLEVRSYALREIRPGPLVPVAMTPTILLEEPGTVAPGITPT